jgi:putative protease
VTHDELNTTQVRQRPELLAPAGDRECLVAAIENGADAVYFGLQTHNARARAANFALDDLPDTMALLHGRGVRGYVTLNTLIFPSEMAGVEALIRRITEAGVDALIVQDIGLCRLARRVSPELELHASTQMSVTSLDGVRLAADLGCSRVILARELSTTEIGRITRESPLPVEVFVHGALCVAYSGQCLTSEALGGRSANRGECAQACRMPYEMICDGQPVPLGGVQYLLSPQDLAAYDLVPKLAEMGVASLKIEGRLKSPEYVANITRHYRRAIDAASDGSESPITPADVYDMEMSFSRGFSHGFLDGNDHKHLVRGDYGKKRGVFLGEVVRVEGPRVRLSLKASLKPGDGVVFDGDESTGVPEQGGRVYEVRPATAETAIVGFGHRDLDPARLHRGQRAWKTDDPELSRRLRATFEGAPKRRLALDLAVTAAVGEPLALTGSTATGLTARVASPEPLSPAQTRPATEPEIREQLGRLGGTVYELRHLTARIEGQPMVPKSLLNALRRDLVDRLDAAVHSPTARPLAEGLVLPEMRGELARHADVPDAPAAPELSVLCRHQPQALAALADGVRTIYLEYADPKTLAPAVAELRQASPEACLYVATPRIEKPGEANLFRLLMKSGADGLLVRNAGGLAFAIEQHVPFVVDFSFNAANELSAEWLKHRGAQRVTASYDLSFDQLDDLLATVPPAWLEVVIHQHMPMFHMEFCTFSAFLSNGKPYPECGRPCDHHNVALRDRVGAAHPLKADVGCRNTLFNVVPQTAAEYLPQLISRGVQHLRVEFLDDEPVGLSRILGLYRDAIEGRRDARNLWRELKATSQYGVTRGQLAVIQ